MKNIAIMVDGDTTTIYSLKVNKEKLFDMLGFIVRYCGSVSHSKRCDGSENFKKGLEFLFCKDGLKTDFWREKGKVVSYTFYEYSPLAKSVHKLLRDPSQLAQLDETVKQLKDYVESLPKEKKYLKLLTGLDGLDLSDVYRKKKIGTIKTSDVPTLLSKLSEDSIDKGKELERLKGCIVKKSSLLGTIKDSIFVLPNKKVKKIMNV